MAAKLLLPGQGGAYTSESFTAASSYGADVLDCSRCGQLVVQVQGDSGTTGTFTLQQSLDGTRFSTFASLNAVDGTMLRLDNSDGPFGLVRILAAVISSSAVLLFVGQPIQRMA